MAEEVVGRQRVAEQDLGQVVVEVSAGRRLDLKVTSQSYELRFEWKDREFATVGYWFAKTGSFNGTI